MTSPLPAYQNILNQAGALEQSIAWHSSPGRAALVQAASLLKQADKIVLVSIGASYNAALPFIYRFARAGKRILLEDAAEFLHYTHASYSSPTLFLFVSRSGSTIEITRSLELLKGRGHFIIGITNEPESPLARQADLPVIFGGPNDDLIAVQTYLTTLLTLDLLAETVLADPQAAQFRSGLDEMVQAVKKIILNYRSGSHPAFDFSDFHGVYLLGRGPSLGSTLQGTLMFHEMARFPAQAVGAGAFRHGLWEVADERTRIFIFAPSDSTYELSLALAGDLAGARAEVVVLASRPLPAPGWKNVSLWDLPGVDVRWSPYLEIIPVQFFVYEFTRWQGLTPGVFRTSTPVILSETGSLASDHEQ